MFLYGASPLRETLICYISAQNMHKSAQFCTKTAVFCQKLFIFCTICAQHQTVLHSGNKFPSIPNCLVLCERGASPPNGATPQTPQSFLGFVQAGVNPRTPKSKTSQTSRILHSSEWGEVWARASPLAGLRPVWGGFPPIPPLHSRCRTCNRQFVQNLYDKASFFSLVMTKFCPNWRAD